MLKGCDTSTYQGQINFDSLKAGVDFVFIKATEGVGYMDNEFTRSQTEARRVGLLLGYYHFARPDLGNSAEDEAAWFIQTVNPQADEILALDFEVSYSDPVGFCKAFLDALSSKLNGYKPLIYLNLNLVNTHDWSPVISAGYGLWLADYDGVVDNTPNTPWPVVAMKQYSSSGQVSGISGKVDMDSFFGDEVAFKAYGYHAITSVPTTSGNPPIGPDVPLVLSDSTKLNFGVSLGILEFGAVRSKLLDNERDLASSKTTIDDLTQKLADAKKQIEALQLINKTQVQDVKDALNSAPTTVSSTVYHVVPNQPISAPNKASLLSRILSWIFRQ